MTPVRADDDEVLRLAAQESTIVLYEPPALIGGAGGEDRLDPTHRHALREAARRADDARRGVSAPGDAYAIMCAGAAGTGSTSGVLCSASPTRAAEELIAAARR